jgi:hypothetical protein
MYVYERMYSYVPAVGAAAPTVFMAWQLARSYRTVVRRVLEYLPVTKLFTRLCAQRILIACHVCEFYCNLWNCLEVLFRSGNFKPSYLLNTFRYCLSARVERNLLNASFYHSEEC